MACTAHRQHRKRQNSLAIFSLQRRVIDPNTSDTHRQFILPQDRVTNGFS